MQLLTTAQYHGLHESQRRFLNRYNRDMVARTMNNKVGVQIHDHVLLRVRRGCAHERQNAARAIRDLQSLLHAPTGVSSAETMDWDSGEEGMLSGGEGNDSD